MDLTIIIFLCVFVWKNRRRAHMEELTKLLNNVQGSYYDFIVAMLHYAKKKKSRLIVLTDFIKKNKDLTTSDIIEFVSSQPDFFEDAAYTKKVS